MSCCPACGIIWMRMSVRQSVSPCLCGGRPRYHGANLSAAMEDVLACCQLTVVND